MILFILLSTDTVLICKKSINLIRDSVKMSHIIGCFSTSQQIYPILKDVLQRTEPSHKMGLGTVILIYLPLYHTLADMM